VRTRYVVVDPEAAHHVEGLVTGWHDSPLTPAGAQAAILIAGALRDMIPAAADAELYSSLVIPARELRDVAGRRACGSAGAIERAQDGLLGRGRRRDGEPGQPVLTQQRD
jgi:broad specificity phosphatase PhoE